jgi:transcriptional regulator with XRE-family HTH domain
MEYQEFGQLLMAARLNAGVAQQSDLALRVGVEQQTVSRWELGKSRPKPGKLNEIIAVLQILERNELISAAGYAIESEPQATFDQPWPVDALSPTSFERFCADFLARMFSEADVHRYGDQGHKQHGIDIEAIFPDGRVFVFQCKRHTAFGPQKIAAAVKEMTKNAERKVILLAGIASPQAREAIKQYSGWELWDIEDITRLARKDLAKVDQLSLVDSFFAGQRFALLGELEPSIWRSPDEFFAGMSELHGGFSHAWEIVGRESELDKLKAFATSQSPAVVLLTGNGGAGKTRVLREFARRNSEDKSLPPLYFLSRETLTSKALDQLGKDRKLLVCDDAHEREDLGLLLDYVANASNNARLVLSLRIYGMTHVKQQGRSLTLSDMPEVRLPKLTRANGEELAKQAIAFYGGDQQNAQQLAAFTLDCPLATVVGARVLSSGKSVPAFLLGEEAFRAALLDRWAAQIVEEISRGLNVDAVRTTLCAIALLQPVHDNDQTLNETLSRISGQKIFDVARILKRLREAGVLFSRANKSRVAPDLLGDFLIENLCIDDQGRSTGFAEMVFDSVEETYVENVLVNLGRLDWQKSNGDTGQSRVMDDLWSRLRWDHEFHSPHVQAAAAVAYYQPRQAMAFARRLIAEGHVNEEVTKILERAAYNLDCLAEACELLWSLGINDARPQNQNPHHGIRVLTELASPRPDKPLQYIARVIDFAASLVEGDVNWSGVHTPIDILDGVLATEGHTTTWRAYEMTMTPFMVAQKAMGEQRKRAIEICISLLGHSDSRRAYRAATALHLALRYPVGTMGARTTDENYENWTAEFCQTLQSVNDYLNTHSVATVVLTRLAESVSWHLFHSDGPTKPLAKTIISRLDGGIRARTIRLLIDGWGHMTFQFDDSGVAIGQEQMLKSVVDELNVEYPDADNLRKFLEDCLAEVAQSEKEIHGSAYILIGRLQSSSIALSQNIVENTRQNPDSLTASFASAGLAVLLEKNFELAQRFVSEILRGGDGPELAIVAQAYSRYKPMVDYTEIDLAALRLMGSSNQLPVLSSAADAAHQVCRFNKALGAELLTSANFSVAMNTTHHYLMWLCHESSVPFSNLSDEQIQSVLNKLMGLKNLDDHWAQEFLGKALARNPLLTIAFLQARVEHALRNEDWSYRPVSHGPYQRKSFGLSKQPEATVWIKQLLEWALPFHENGLFKHRFGELVNALCAPFDSVFIGALESWAVNKTRAHVDIALAVLREAPRNFIFENEPFVRRFFRSAQSFGEQAVRDTTSNLFSSAISGVRSGAAGQPFPEDIALLEAANKVLAKLGAFDPAHHLYEGLRKYAQQAIDSQVAERKLVEEENEDI